MLAPPLALALAVSCQSVLGKLDAVLVSSFNRIIGPAVLERCRLGNRVTVHAGTVIGGSELRIGPHVPRLIMRATFGIASR